MIMTDSVEQQVPEEVIKQLFSHYETLEAEYAPDICNTLGIMAVQGDLARSVILAHAEPWLDSELPDANEGIANFLQETRDRVAAIDADKRLEVGLKVLHRKVPQFLLNRLGVEYDHQIFERLVEQNPDDSYAVSDDTLLNFLQWHSYSMKEWRERFMEKDWPGLKLSHMYQLKTAVKDGWLPECVLRPSRLDALEQAEVTVDDGMLLHEEDLEAFATFDTGSATEVYFPQYPFLETVYHELSHVMVGVEVPRDKSKERFSGEQRTRGLYRLFDEKHTNAGRVLDEAVTVQIASTMGEFPQNPDLINPDAKDYLFGNYIVERKLLDFLCNGGARPIDIRLFTRAYFEDSTRLRQPALRKLKRGLAKAFPGRDVLDELGVLMSKDEYKEARENLGDFTRSIS